jgi:CspA family cold shock protein
MQGVYEGKVKWYSEARGFGFIESDGQDYFFHASGIIQDGSPSLKSSETVTFTLIDHPKGAKAINVSRKPLTTHKGANHETQNRTE